MRIEFTVIGPAGPRDVGVTAPAGTPLAAVLPALARLAGTPSTQPAWSGQRRLDPRGTLDEAGVLTGAVVRFGTSPPADDTGLLTLRVVGGAVSAAPIPVTRGEQTLGRDPGCDVVLADDRASRHHAVLRADGRGVTVHDTGSTNGTSVDGRPVPPSGTRVGVGELIRVGDSLLELADGGPTTPAVLLRGPGGLRQVNRAPRSAAPHGITHLDAVTPVRPTRPGPVHWVAALVPAAAGGVLAWTFGSPALLLFAVLSPVVLLAGAAGDRVRWRRTSRRAAVAARRDEADLAGRVRAALDLETRARRRAAPDPAAVLEIATLPGRRLWERERSDDDFLTVRVGVGDTTSSATVSEAGRTRPAGTVPLVPHAVDLRAGALGVVGPAGHVDTALAWLAGQLAVLHAPSDVEFVVLSAGGAAWLRWLPHLRAGPSPTVLGGLLARRDRQTTADDPAGPWTVVIAADPVDELSPAGVAALADLLADGPARRVTALLAARTTAALPTGCRHVAAIGDATRPDGGSGCSLVLHPAGEASGTTLLADRVSAGWGDQVARALAPLTDARAGGVPDAECRFAELVPVDTAAVLERWASADGGARTLLGMSGDGPVGVDLVADGPHALVVGTTGAGKSELLRTLVVGLASCHPPDELAFLLVDYKGGAAFGAAARLPHTTGVVTDLDSALTGRALQSLDAELRRRERAFARVGADDLDGYRIRRGAVDGAEPLARLVVVVDEFAELAAVVPDFVTGLVSVARRGRALGLHLVLATQRPGTALTPEIRANTALRVALRVIEPAESGDVIGVPDAALLDPRHPGRGYLLRGGELVAMRTARVAGASIAAAEPLVEALGPWRAPPPRPGEPPADGLRDTVESLRRTAGLAGRAAPRAPWLPPLPDTIALATVGAHDDGAALALGRLDLPAEQRQPPLLLTVPGESVLVVGGPGAGRTTTLLTTALAAAGRYGPDTLTVHTIGRDDTLRDVLADLPHIGTSVTRESYELLPGLLTALTTRPTGPVLLLLDDWDLVLADCDDAVAARCTDLLAALPGPTTSVVVAGGRALLYPRFAASFPTRYVLPMADPADYALAGVPGLHGPGRGVGARAGPGGAPGGGVRVPDGAVLRIAHPGDAPGAVAARAAAQRVAAQRVAAQRVAAQRVAAQRVAAQRATPPVGRRELTALRLRPLPPTVTVTEVRDRARRAGLPDGPVLGVAGETAQPCLLDVAGRGLRLLVAGPTRSGRSTLLLTLAAEAARQGHRVVAVAPRRSPLHAALPDALHGALHDRGDVIVSDAGPVDVPGADRTTLLLVDDVERCDDTIAAQLVDRLRAAGPPLGVAVAGRVDELATGYRPLVAEVRRDGCGVLLRPSRLDGDLLGVRIVPRPEPAVPGRGVLVGDPGWGEPFTGAATLPVQVAVVG